MLFDTYDTNEDFHDFDNDYDNTPIQKIITERHTQSNRRRIIESDHTDISPLRHDVEVIETSIRHKRRHFSTPSQTQLAENIIQTAALIVSLTVQIAVTPIC